MKQSSKNLAALILLSLCAAALPAYAADLPRYFDLRLTNPTDRQSAATDAIVGEVRNQLPYEDCWAFATTASLEGSINLQRQKAGLGPIARLSERYLNWLTWAPPLDGGGDGFVFGNIQDPAHHTLAVYASGDSTYQPVSTLVRYGTAYNDQYPYVTNPTDTSMAGISSPAGNGVALHDNFGLQAAEIDTDTGNLYPTKNLNKNIAYYKEMLQTCGILRINYAVDATEPTPSEMRRVATEINICTTTPKPINHAVTLVGWDDDYTMTINGVTHKGAWLMRNSWGTDYEGTPVGVDGTGYFYLSYDDATVSTALYYNAETDWGRYTAVNTAAPGGQTIGFSYDEIAKSHPKFAAQGSYKTASKLASSASQILKAVGIFVPADSMSYKIEVSLKGDTPANTTTIYTQSGTFGEDGTAMYKGYRTVDFDKFVYLPSGQKYFVTVTLTGKDGTTYYIPISDEDNKNLTPGTSFLYDAATGTWDDVQMLLKKTTSGIPLFALSKYSKEANGGDFTVVSLNDNGVGGSGIYLGKKDELYTTDLLHPATDHSPTSYRYTLSNMTVELTKGLTDSVYGGVISGEGSVTKTGTGLLALSGTNTYTGATTVKEGTFALTGSLQSPVTVASSATFTGYGTINGNLTNSGTLVPGLNADAQNLLTTAASGTGTATTSKLGTLTVNGDFINTGTLQMAVDGIDNSKITVSGNTTLTGGTLNLTSSPTLPITNHQYTYLTSQGGITGNGTTQAVSPYITLTTTVNGTSAYFTANQTQNLGSLANLTPSENSVSTALNNYLQSTAAINPTSATARALTAVLYQNEATSRTFTKQVTSESRAQLLSQSPLSNLTSESVSSRLGAVNFSGLVAAEVALPHLTMAQKNENQISDSVSTSTPVTLDANNNLWFKLFKGYETFNYADELKDHSFGGAVGYDKAINLTTRVGGLFSYGITNYSTDNMSGDSHDWRVGAYIDHKNGNWDYQGLVTYGHNKYDLDRDVLGARLNSDYKAKVWDVEATAKYLIPSTARKTWHFTPYGKVSYTHSSQDAYGETGSSVFAQNIESTSHNSTRGEIGIEFKRAYDKNGGFGGSVGYKRVISGLNPELNGTFVGDNNNFTLSTDNDRNFVTYSINVHGKLAKNWTGQAELRGEASNNTHKEIISVAAKYSF